MTTPDVRNTHDLHVRSLMSGKTSLTVHLVDEPVVNPGRDALPVTRDRLAERFDITHIAIQFELRSCVQVDAATHFQPSESTVATTSG